MSQHEVVVGNIGTVYSGADAAEAELHFELYMQRSQQRFGRAADQPVTWFRDGEIYSEYEF